MFQKGVNNLIKYISYKKKDNWWMVEEYPEQSSTKILQNRDMAVGKLEDRR